jgi:hypothetical protein
VIAHGGRNALIVAALLSLPFATTGIFADDYYHQLLMDRSPAVTGSPWQLFTFATGEWSYLEPMVTSGPFAWWTLEELRFIFLRPTSVASALLDHALFGRQYVFHHLHSAAWYVALVAVVVAFFRQAFRSTVAAVSVAALLFAVDDAHAMVAGWIANRNALIATLFALLGVMAHVRWREQGWRVGLPVSLGAVALGLSAGESALGAVAYLLAYELTVAPGDFKKRAASLVPLALLGVLYIGVYRWFGAGAYGSGIYVDPIREPVEFLLGGPGKALALIGSQFLGSTADFWLALPALRPVLVGTGVVALLLMILFVRRAWPSFSADEQRAVRWLTVGGALSLVPVLATFPLNRLLLMPSVGGAALGAVVLVHGWRSSDRVLRFGSRLLFVTMPIVGVVGWVLSFGAIKLVTDQLLRSAVETELSDDALAGNVIVFVAPDPVSALYTPLARAYLGKKPKSWLTFSFARYPHRLKRVSERVFELEIDGRLMESVFEQLMRAERFPLPIGFRRQLAGVAVEVIGHDQGLPNRLRLTFDEDPSSGRYTFAQWKDAKLVAFTLPAVGETHDFGLVVSAVGQ